MYVPAFAIASGEMVASISSFETKRVGGTAPIHSAAIVRV
jgi:hypothetical protein